MSRRASSSPRSSPRKASPSRRLLRRSKICSIPNPAGARALPFKFFPSHELFRNGPPPEDFFSHESRLAQARASRLGILGKRKNLREDGAQKRGRAQVHP